MKTKLLLTPVIAVILGGGYLVYTFGFSSVPQNGSTTTNSGVTTTNGGVSAPSGSGLYSCTGPAINTYKFCDKLPTGYQITARLPNAPQPFCPAGTSDTACVLLKQTQSNGVCDPNETVWSDPLDCGCTGSLIADPFTGRCGAPATVCQLQAQIQNAKQGG